MTWEELADFILRQMPECNRTEQVTLWDAESGEFYKGYAITPYSPHLPACARNPYSIEFDSKEESYF